jgi:ankyrin repeat protein
MSTERNAPPRAGRVAALFGPEMRDLPRDGPPPDADVFGPAGQHVFLPPGTVVADRYVVRERIGHGHWAAVFEVDDQLRNRRIAMKVPTAEVAGSTTMRDRFLEEAKIATSLSHPNIVNCFDFGQDGALLYLTMEALRGRTLRRWMDDRRASGQVPTYEEVKAWALQLCDALTYAHRFTVHRDVKPENVFICDDHTAKLLDFGLARAINAGAPQSSSSSSSMRGAVLSAAGYRAPEMDSGLGQADHRVDQFALAVVLYELLSGARPAGVVRPLHACRPDVPRAVSAAVARAMCADAADRFDSLDPLAAALRGEGGAGRRWGFIAAGVAAIGAVAVAVAVGAGARLGGGGGGAQAQPAPKAAGAALIDPNDPSLSALELRRRGDAAVAAVDAALQSPAVPANSASVPGTTTVSDPTTWDEFQASYENGWRSRLRRQFEAGFRAKYDTARATHQSGTDSAADAAQVARTNRLFEASVPALEEVAQGVRQAEGVLRAEVAQGLLDRATAMLSEREVAMPAAAEELQAAAGVAGQDGFAVADKRMEAVRLSLEALSGRRQASLHEESAARAEAARSAWLDLRQMSGADHPMGAAGDQAYAKAKQALKDRGAGASAAFDEAEKAYRTATAELRNTLRERVAGLTEVPDGGQAPILDAARRGDHRVILTYLAGGGRASAADANGLTLLHLSAAAGSAAAVEHLVKAGASLEAKAGPEGKTPLLAAVAAGQSEAALKLLELGADPAATDGEGRNALELAAEAGASAEAFVAKLDPKRLRVSAYDAKLESGRERFRKLAAADNPDALRLLIAAGADPSPADGREEPAIIAAAKGGAWKSVAALAEAGADVGARDRNGYTALHFAAENGAADAIRQLVEAGADPSAKNRFGSTPMDLAKDRGHADLFKKSQ